VLSKHVLFLTSTNLACNPRCLKEVKLLKEMGASVTVVAFNLHNWSTQKEVEITEQLLDVNCIYLDTTKKKIVTWTISSLIERLAGFLFPFYSSKLIIAALTLGKRGLLLLDWCMKTKLKPDLIIAHNPAAFFPAYWLAKKNEIPFGLDIEDYHPGESITQRQKQALKLLMKELINKAHYASFASLQIRETSVQQLQILDSSLLVINNFFSKSHFSASDGSGKEKIQLVWFSQNIDKGRGLEELLDVFGKFDNAFHLTLIGNLKEPFSKQYILGRKNITVLKPMHPTELTKAMSQFDVGLAIEPGKDLNNTIALSNKIITYFQAGLYILASKTPAQDYFLEKHSEHGISTMLNSEHLSFAFHQILADKGKILNLRHKRYDVASKYNWESESIQLVQVWNQLLSCEKS
jgi:glycosyltransferase involved in cell wall biosynthesis